MVYLQIMRHHFELKDPAEDAVVEEVVVVDPIFHSILLLSTFLGTLSICAPLCCPPPPCPCCGQPSCSCCPPPPCPCCGQPSCSCCPPPPCSCCGQPSCTCCSPPPTLVIPVQTCSSPCSCCGQPSCPCSSCCSQPTCCPCCQPVCTPVCIMVKKLVST